MASKWRPKSHWNLKSIWRSIVIASLRPPRLVGHWCEQHIRQDVNWPNSVSAFRSRCRDVPALRLCKTSVSGCVSETSISASMEILPKNLSKSSPKSPEFSKNGAQVLQKWSPNPQKSPLETPWGAPCQKGCQKTPPGPPQDVPWTPQSRPKGSPNLSKSYPNLSKFALKI